MERALTEPGLGYYATSELRPTREGDFLTAPELHPFFGRCLGRFLTAVWRAAGAPERYLVREHGAGRGTLRDTVMAGLAADASGLAGAIGGTRSTCRTRGGAEEAAHIVVANEYLDALPVHRLVRRAVSARRTSSGGTGGSARRSMTRRAPTSPVTCPPTESFCARASGPMSAWPRLAGWSRLGRPSLPADSSSSSTTATRRPSCTDPGGWPGRC
jgi:hypothetical protein